MLCKAVSLLFVFVGTLFLQKSKLYAQNIGLFYHPDYVQIEEGNLFAEASNLYNTLEDFGYEINEIEEFTKPEINASDIIIIPELERKNLFLDLSSNQIEDIESYVRNGGGLIISGVVAPNEANNNNAIQFLNGVFGYNLKSQEFTLTGHSLKNENLPFNGFNNSPVEIPNNNAIAFLTGVLPSDAVSLYADKENENNSSVAVLNHGKGKIIYLGWGWWNALPNGSQDGGWFEILENSIDLLLCKQPSISAPNELSFDLPSSGLLELRQEDLGALVFSCTQDYHVTFSMNKFDCEKLGQHDLEISIEDGIGRVSKTNIIINVEDPNGVCSAVSQYTNLTGQIKDRNNNLLKGSNVELISETTYNAVFAENGSYNLDDVLIEGGYAIQSKKEGHYLNGVTTYDIFLMASHMIGAKPFDSPYQFIAADVNNSGSITAKDILEMRNLVLYVDTEFENHSSWQLFPDLNELDDPLSPIHDEAFELTKEDLLNPINFTGVKIGDVNHSASTGRNINEEVILRIEEKEFEKDELINVLLHFDTKEIIGGFQLSIDLSNDFLEFVDLSTNLQNFSESNVNLVKNRLLISFVNDEFIGKETAFKLELKTKAKGKISDAIAQDMRLMPSEVYSKDFSISNVKFKFGDIQKEAITNITTLKNHIEAFPNPFSESTMIHFEASKAQTAIVTIFNATGAIIFEDKMSAKKGENSYNIAKEIISFSGIYHFKIKVDDKVYTNKMIKM